jgi:16S rRNA (guanine527-N7)-methyltransferase
MVDDTIQYAKRAAVWAGVDVTETIADKLLRYHDWLSNEAIVAGGLGPNEAGRIWARHIGDALLFAVGVRDAGSCVDIGTGVGLPGIPLGIVMENTWFELVDRSQRRIDLLHRIITVLRLENCRVIHRDITDVDKKFDAVVARAAMPVGQLMIHVKHLLRPGGTATIGLSRRQVTAEPVELPADWTSDVVSVPHNILDTTVNLLRIVAA